MQLTQNLTGQRWESDTVEDERDPEWGVAAFDGAPVDARTLEDFGITVEVYDEDFAVDDQLGRGVASFSEDEFDGDLLTVSADCIDVTLSLVAAD